MPISTGCPTLDSILDGGLPENRMVLLTGTPGTGKSTLGMQFLQEGLANDEECLFVSTEQTHDELQASFAPFEFDLEHPDLTITSIHAAPGRTFESNERELVIETFEEGELFGQGFSAPFESGRIQEVLERFAPCDRVVLDSVSGLEPMAGNHETYRRGVLDLVQFFSREFGATSLFTAEQSGDVPQTAGAESIGTNDIQYNAHGVIRLWRQRLAGDYHRFLDVMKMRGADHDTRQFEIEFEDGGVAIVPRRRVHPSEFVTHDHCSTGIPGLDELGGGGVVQGTGVLLEHDGRASIDAIIASLLAQGVEEGMAITLMPTVDMKRERLAEMLRTHGSVFRDGLGELFERDQLFVLDAAGAWEADENIFNLRHEDAGLRYLLQQIDDRADADGNMLLFNTEAKVHASDRERTREIRYWMEANFISDEDVLVDIHNPNVMGESLAEFYADASGQILKTWLEETGLQYVRLKKSPSGEVGTSRLVEFVDEVPYVNVR